jgi:hypothetical protein
MRKNVRKFSANSPWAKSVICFLEKMPVFDIENWHLFVWK